MKNIQREKENLRKEILSVKKKYSQEELAYRSQEVLSVLEILGVFQEAKNIFIYHNLKDEVQTIDFIHKWENEKTFYLPVIEGENMFFREYSSASQIESSQLGIKIPTGENFIAYKKVDLIIVPGIAFDRKKNRLGRGKGYYDRFLSQISVVKVGICFDFQLFDRIPAGELDIKMDYVVSENDIIW